MTLVLCWDIDGTLLTTGRAGILAWEDAAAEMLDRTVDFSTLDTAGRTDVQIAALILTRFGLDATPENLARLIGRYEELLPLKLPLRSGSVLPGVLEVLSYLRGYPDIVSLLLTGNTRTGGRAKLRHYGLQEYFDHGAFADGTRDRATIARRALALAEELVGQPMTGDRTYVIGDTPHDVECAREIGARSIAVASGAYATQELRRHDPWWVIERLPAPDVFLDRLRKGHGA